MTIPSKGGTDSRVVVGYFSDGAQASRAINELIDEGFSASEIGAAFRTERAAAGSATQPLEEPAMGEMTGLTDKNPALTGSVGGAASHDQAVTPAGLAPGSGNAFPAVSAPGPIPGGEIPHNLPHDLPSTLPSTIPSTLRGDVAPAAEVMPATGLADKAPSQREEGWWDHVKQVFGGSPTSQGTAGPRVASSSSLKFGTGEGHLGVYPQYDYSETAFEGSFVGMGVGPAEARSLSGQLSRGGAVVTVNASQRASLAEAILERNHGRVRLERTVEDARQADRNSRVEVYGSMRDYYRGEDELRQRRAS